MQRKIYEKQMTNEICFRHSLEKCRNLIMRIGNFYYQEHIQQVKCNWIIERKAKVQSFKTYSLRNKYSASENALVCVV